MMLHHYPAEETAIHHHRVSTFVTRSLGLGVLFVLASGCRRLFHDHQRLWLLIIADIIGELSES